MVSQFIESLLYGTTPSEDDAPKSDSDKPAQ